MSNDLISRAALLDIAEQQGHVTVDDIVGIPAIEPQVVRCRECKHWKTRGEFGDCAQWKQSNDENAETSKDDFCSCGERMDAAPPNTVPLD